VSENVIHIEGLTFGYTKKERVIEDMNLHVPQRSIYGFLGANGAGKTTTLKMILGLIRFYQGDISVFGRSTKTEYPKYLNQIGSLIENPSFYAHLSAADNLKIWSKYYNADLKRIPEILELVDLQKDSNKKTQHFSTGMKQRLGLAAALLHDPQLLILDEPTNGLDPMGIIELRKVLSRLNNEGKTIILSSHILSEVERMVTHLGILKNGSLAFEGTIDELHAQREKNIEVIIQVNDANAALSFIDLPHQKIISDEVISVRLEEKAQIPALVKKLTDQGIEIFELKQSNKNLEAMFLSISNEKPSTAL